MLNALPIASNTTAGYVFAAGGNFGISCLSTAPKNKLPTSCAVPSAISIPKWDTLAAKSDVVLIIFPDAYPKEKTVVVKNIQYIE
jgi:hypothetical protein